MCIDFEERLNCHAWQLRLSSGCEFVTNVWQLAASSWKICEHCLNCHLSAPISSLCGVHAHTWIICKCQCTVLTHVWVRDDVMTNNTVLLWRIRDKWYNDLNCVQIFMIECTCMCELSIDDTVQLTHMWAMNQCNNAHVTNSDVSTVSWVGSSHACVGSWRLCHWLIAHTCVSTVS